MSSQRNKAIETMVFSDLPQELESEILSRVPAASLAQLRTTCKRWYALFKDPRFIENNSSKSGKKRLVFTDSYGVCSFNINLHKPSFEITGRLKSLKDSKEVSISEIFQCDSLLLCRANNNRLVVWNPCTGQTRWIEIVNGSGNFFLGYQDDNNNTSYKILGTSYFCNPNPKHLVRYEIYDFNSDSWRAFFGGPTCNWITTKDQPSVSLNGNAYSIAYERKDDSRFHEFLLKFDFRRERFEHLSLPCEVGPLIICGRLSVVGQEKLYVLDLKVCQGGTYEYDMKLWVTDAKINEAKDSKIQYSLVAYLSRIMIKELSSVHSFLVEEENKIVVSYRQLNKGKPRGDTMIGIVGHQDGEMHFCKQFTRQSDCYWSLLVSYVPSLVQIPQLEESILP